MYVLAYRRYFVAENQTFLISNIDTFGSNVKAFGSIAVLSQLSFLDFSLIFDVHRRKR